MRRGNFDYSQSYWVIVERSRLVDPSDNHSIKETILNTDGYLTLKSPQQVKHVDVMKAWHDGICSIGFASCRFFNYTGYNYFFIFQEILQCRKIIRKILYLW